MAEIFYKALTEEQLFEIKQKFLQEIPHPKLIQKQIDRLKEYELEGMMIENLELEGESELETFLQQYIAMLLTCKLKIANAENGSTLLKSLYYLKHLQQLLIKNLSLYMPSNTSADDASIKQSDPFDAYAYMKELQGQNVKENEIKDYLCTQFEQNPDDYSQLARGVLRAVKIANQ